MANFGLATNERFKQDGELKERVCFVDVVTFGKTAENACQYLVKGSGVIVDGRLQQQRWQGEDGKNHSKHEVIANQVTYLPKPGGQGEAAHDEQEEPS